MRAHYRFNRLAVPCRLIYVGLFLMSCQSAGSPTPTAAVQVIVTNTPLPQIQSSPTTAASHTPIPSPTADTRLIDTFAPDVDPLTGEQVADPSVLQRRPLAIKVANSNESGVRPQSGVSSADLVFEHETEGGVTRWTAMFLSHTPERVGSNRSCRIIDADLPAMYKSLLACSGFSGGTREYYIKPTEFYAEGRVLSPDFGDGGGMFFRTTNASAPHNLFVDPEVVWAEAARRGVNEPQDLTGMVFSDEPLQSDRAANTVLIPYRAERAEWRYDANASTCSSQPGCYLRWSDGAVHSDALNGQQLSAANVVIIYVNHVEDGRYLEDVAGGGHYSIQLQIWNDPTNPALPGGRAQVIRDGQLTEARWSRPGRLDMFRFIDEDGNPVPFKPGITWFQLVRLDAEVSIEPAN